MKGKDMYLEAAGFASWQGVRVYRASKALGFRGLRRFLRGLR